MKVRFKNLGSHLFATPTYAKSGDAGLDLTATNITEHHNYIEYGTSLAVEIPEGYVGLIFPRSSISKTKHSFANAVAVIDSNYRGEIKIRMRFKHGAEYVLGDKVAQLIILPYPKIELEEAETLTETERGDGSFGSTGR